MIKVKAKVLGYYGLARRYPGDEFMVEDKKHIGSWMEVIEEPRVKQAPKVGPKKSEPAKGEGEG